MLNIQLLVDGFCDDERLPPELKYPICIQSIHSMFPQLKNIPVALIIRKIESLLQTTIPAKRFEKATDWFITRAYALWRKEIIGISEPNHTRFSDFKRLWKECFKEFFAQTTAVLNRPLREALLVEFKKVQRPLTKSKLDQVINITAAQLRHAGEKERVC